MTTPAPVGARTAHAALGSGPLTEAGVRAHIAPLFSRVLAAQRDRIYLANHSLGRPLDATEDDVREGLALWYARLGDAWDEWGAEMAALPRAARRAARRAAPRLHRAEDERGAGPARGAEHATIACRASSPRAASSIRST